LQSSVEDFNHDRKSAYHAIAKAPMAAHKLAQKVAVWFITGANDWCIIRGDS
jgi:uncharacterized protein YdbL (DUF1318 family)